MQITLTESLCGFHKVIKTLDNRQLVITSLPGEVIKPGDIKCLLNEGMPVYRNPLEKGRLVLHFDVKFPDKNELRSENLTKLETLLPARTPVQVPMNAEECVLVEFDPRQSQQRSNRREMFEDGDPRGRGGGGGGPTQVNCATQ